MLGAGRLSRALTGSRGLRGAPLQGAAASGASRAAAAWLVLRASRQGSRPAVAWRRPADREVGRRGLSEGSPSFSSSSSSSSSSSARSKLYDTHVPTTAIEKLLLAARSAVGALQDPERADLVATLGDTTGGESLKRMHRLMRENAVGMEVLRDRPIVSEQTVRFEDLRSLPEGTFGRAYTDFMDSRGYTPDERPDVRFVDEEELAYVMRRYREVHDFVHVLTGLGTTVEGEIVQKWLELLHTGLPVCLLSAFVGPLKLAPEQRLRLATEWVPWVARCAAHSPFMLNVYYEKHFEEDLGALRARLGIPPLPYGVPAQAAVASTAGP